MNALHLLRRWLALSALAHFAATWRLWTPQVVFPQIPFFEFLCTVPGWVDWLALTGVILGLLGLLLIPGERGASVPRVLSSRAVSWFAGLFLASLTTLVLLNQHRFQPWTYQFAIVAVVLAFVPAQRAVSLLRLLTIGIYFWSAVSKLDYTFLHGLGPDLLHGLLTAFGLEPRWMRADVATAMALAFPLDELAVAALLAFRPTRKYGLVLSIAMHLLLLATLGPWGLDHSWGVLLWNVYFIGQNVVLFAPEASGGHQTLSQATTSPVPLSLGRGVRGEGGDDASISPGIASSSIPAEPHQSTHDAAGPPLTPGPSPQRRGETTPLASNDQTRRLTPAARFASWIVYAAVVLPVLEPFSWLDHWPGWAVYAPSAEKVRVSVSHFMEPESPHLPEYLRPYFTLWVGPSFPSGSRLDLWSIDALSTPIYPDERFHVGVAIAVLERYDLEHFAWLLVDSRANRFTGERSNEGYVAGRFPGDKQSQLNEHADSFWLNTRPRKLGGWGGTP